MAAKTTAGPCDLPSDISEEDRGRVKGRKYEFSLDTQQGGDNIQEAFEQVVMAMFGYMTDLTCVESRDTQEITAEGQDMESLLYHFMDEWLFLFCADPFFIPKEVKITKFDRENFTITSMGYGETFDLKKHPQGTEVKAITYSNMQIYDTEDNHECYVIIDI